MQVRSVATRRWEKDLYIKAYLLGCIDGVSLRNPLPPGESVLEG